MFFLPHNPKGLNKQKKRLGGLRHFEDEKFGEVTIDRSKSSDLRGLYEKQKGNEKEFILSRPFLLDSV